MLRLLVALAVTIAVGLASRQHPIGWFLWDRVLGEVLYAVAAYLVWAMILFRRSPWLIAAVAFGCCLAVELFKLTGVPAANQDVFFVRWFLGMVFDPVNLLYYLTGAVLTALADSATRFEIGRIRLNEQGAAHQPPLSFARRVGHAPPNASPVSGGASGFGAGFASGSGAAFGGSIGFGISFRNSDTGTPAISFSTSERSISS